MHRGLGILEIVEMICAQLGFESSESLSTDATSALSALARTSQFFHNPALNVLWRHQDTIVNLLKCMPEDLWDITQGNDDEDDDGPTNIVRDQRSFLSTKVDTLMIASTTDHEVFRLGPPPVLYAPR
jgi:hypothetical protein